MSPIMAGDDAAPQITSRTVEPGSVSGASDADAPRASGQASSSDQARFIGLHAHQRYMAVSGLLEEDVEGRRVLFSTRSGRIYSLNETACRTWMALRVVTAASAAAMMSAEFDVSPERARADVMSLVEALCAEGLLFPA